MPKGRTLFEILTGRNKKALEPLELQYHNPLKARVGNKITFDHEPDLKNINFEVEKMSVYETVIKCGGQVRKFYHTDYHLRGISLSQDKPLRFRLRLVPDADASNELGCKIQVLRLYDEMAWDDGFYNNALNNGSGKFFVNYDDSGVALETPFEYWRVEGATDPYNANVATLADKDGNGKVEESEIERSKVTLWDFCRNTDCPTTNREVTEYLYVEMNDKTRYFTLLRGTTVDAFQITVY